MIIKEILEQHRRDFVAIFKCEHCGHEHKRGGYDDHYYHNTVVPTMVCPDCEKTAGDNYRPLATKYPDEFEI